MTDEQIQENNEILAAFLDAVLEGGPVPHDIAAAAWGVWVSVDAEVTRILRSMDQTIVDLETALYFERLPGGGSA